MVKQTVFPRWKGFNLLNMFRDKSLPEKRWSEYANYSPEQLAELYRFQEEDFQMMAEWGFDFARLPLNYRCFVRNNDYYDLNEASLEALDEAVELGQKYGIHINLALHRAVGYCIGDDFEWGKLQKTPINLWTDREAMDAFVFHWTTFAKRYQGISSKDLSFNLINEPRRISAETYTNVMKETVEKILEYNPERICILDGLNTGNSPVFELGHMAEKHVGQACRGYIPNDISHFGATFLKGDQEMEAKWPGAYHDFENFQDPRLWDKQTLDEHYRMWAAVADAFHMGVHCSEMGCFNKTPHDVALRWLEDLFDILKSYNIGFGMWMLSGTFGVLDSGREDVDYEDYRGHKLDRKMLDLMRKY